jgi:hypothetical protein
MFRRFNYYGYEVGRGGAFARHGFPASRWLDIAWLHDKTRLKIPDQKACFAGFTGS